MSATMALAERHKAAVPRGISTKTLYAARAQNAELWDIEGKRYIDFAAGIAVLNTGHRHPAVMAAVAQQTEAFTHTCFNVAPYETYIRLAERLNAAAPGDFSKKTMFVTTGAEAVENAVKVARRFTGRSAVIAFGGGFHGRTMMTMALTGKVSPYKKGFGPFPAEVYHAPFPKKSHGIDTAKALEGLHQIFLNDVEPARVAAIIVEPVQGEGGFNIAPFSFLQELRAICDEHGILLIADETQTGIARTGRMFAIQHADVVPDLITMAKGLGGGFPLSAVTGRAEIMDAADPGGLGGTYAGNPVSCAAALGVIEAFETEDLLAKSLKQGEMIIKRLTAIKRRKTGRPIGDVRGLGGMTAFEMVTQHGGNEPDAAAAKALAADCLERGLMILTCGVFGETVRLLAPLTIQPRVLKEGLDILEDALTA
jgi:4-aminobutyrate aminotransferase